MTGPDDELRPAYRTLNDPARLLGISVVGWIALLAAGGCGYGWLLVSPLGWRANVSLAVILLGTPAALLLLREESTVSPGRLLLAVLRWRLRPPVIVAPSDDKPVRRGAVCLREPAPEISSNDPSVYWPTDTELGSAP
ncbi:hypothetical protein C8N24_2826 [Solirubrobacter pauli]|uniref:Uncharacterized protein n=1 Tax=Solirubrobacter pauli TaxID=166793 RepID=A0A660LEG5_9ACTN|nr:hypothetical protein [Solirubrobacter pauli]RKQ92969.1 hypothetical protein C8N24_2826 [Solirubrobacter pauli]